MSLRARVIAVVVVVAAVLLLAGVVIVQSTQSYLIERVDAQLRSLAVNDGDMELDVGDLREGDPSPLSAVYVGILQPSEGLHTVASPGLGRTPLPPPRLTERMAEALVTRGAIGPVTVQADGPAGHRYRLLGLRAEIEDERGDEADGLVVIGMPLTDVDASVDRLVLVVSIATITVLLVLGMLAVWVIRLGLRPIDTMTRTARAIAAGDLSQRVPRAASGTEAGQLSDALNAMMASIEGAFETQRRSEERLRQFIADASHELRTPVTTIRGYAELFRTGGLDDPDALASALRRTDAEAGRMGALVEDLLVLARLDQGRPLSSEPVDLGVLAVDAAADAGAVQPARPITVDVREGVVVHGDEARLRQCVGNVVRNACVHTAEDVPVHLRVTREDHQAVVEVRDEGAGMPPEVAARIFERFYRADPSRSRRAGGAGLGMPIVRSAVHAHGGEVTVHSALNLGTTVRIMLPLSPRAEAHS